VELTLKRGASYAYAIMLEKDDPRPFRPKTANRPVYVGPDYELRAIGKWLIVDGAPGLPPRRGPKPDPMSTWRTIVALVVSSHLIARAGKVRRPSRREAAQAWEAVFGEAQSPDAFKARFASAEHAISGFLDAMRTADPRVRWVALSRLLVAFNK
jgi:hypothetical protein